MHMPGSGVSTYVLCIAFLLFGTIAHADECVVLLHGLARTSGSMEPLETMLSRVGYDVVNVDYPSRKYRIEELAEMAVRPGVDGCASAESLHFVTHSLGGILVRYYLEHERIENLGRVVMIAPPNRGSEVVDSWSRMPGYRLLNGPAGYQLGTGENSVPLQLGPVNFEAGIIAGSRTVNPFLSLTLPSPDDGKVSVARAQVEGMSDFIVLPSSHTFIMRAPRTIDQVITFLRTGHVAR